MLGTLYHSLRRWAFGKLAETRPTKGAGGASPAQRPERATPTGAPGPPSSPSLPSSGTSAPTPSEPKTSAPPPTLPPGLTLRDYLNDRIRSRSRWLEGRYGRDQEGTDNGSFLDSLLAPVSTVIRRPPLAARLLLQENRKGTASLSRLAEIIEGDPALLQAVLKHGNSAFYAMAVGGSPIVSVPQALQRIGARGIEIVVMSQLVEGSLLRPGEGLDEVAGAVWSHMVRVAPMARTLARAFGVSPDEAYALGLLHDVGKLLLFSRAADLRKRLRRPLKMSQGFFRAALRELHEPLGGLAVSEWGLGEKAAISVALHHRNPPPEPPSPLCEVIFLAERLDILTEQKKAPDLESIHRDGLLSPPVEELRPLWDGLRLEAEKGRAARAEASGEGESSSESTQGQGGPGPSNGTAPPEGSEGASPPAKGAGIKEASAA